MDTESDGICFLLSKKCIGAIVGRCDDIMGLKHIFSPLEIVWDLREQRKFGGMRPLI
jgi:hypothetical protein